ncbi:hypothetical protein PPTG_21419 [Phytophthora nicotianae INRA-310]|uniref:Uncharacterized protein n=1 Tax=Phytophthora nicotianae (strain INRA-310) TaxID=761204 RepID=W2R1B7_PHYN3|nr:hypothetical protein PPTG_21419 [Phytophthora nicotianae INRA-310]ETN19148.1 hypothetical protein PPTG_21419 [Phytophthora nicotianae INRA-310]
MIVASDKSAPSTINWLEETCASKSIYYSFEHAGSVDISSVEERFTYAQAHISGDFASFNFFPPNW